MLIIESLKMQFKGTIYTFGFGSDHNATLLEAISTQGGGVYYYIDSHKMVINKLTSLHKQLSCTY